MRRALTVFTLAVTTAVTGLLVYVYLLLRTGAKNSNDYNYRDNVYTR